MATRQRADAQRARRSRPCALEGDARFAAIGRLIAEWQPDALVVGVPFHPDGAPHDNTRRAERFARQLHGRFGLPVHEVDERYTTTEALAQGARDVDAAAAALILEQFFEKPRMSTTDSRRRSALRRAARRRARALLQPDTALVGIWSGGAWLAERLQPTCSCTASRGVISSALHRDDFGERGLAPAPARRGCRSRSTARTSC